MIDILTDTETFDTIIRSNVKYWYSIYMEYRYAVLQTNSFGWRTSGHFEICITFSCLYCISLAGIDQRIFKG